MKKGILFLVFLLIVTFLSSTTIQASDYFIGLGITGIQSWESINQGNFQRMSFGLRGTIKLKSFLGITANVIYQGRRYYYSADESNWYGPYTFDTFKSTFNNENLDDWSHIHYQIQTSATLDLFLPAYPIQLYLSIGPAFCFYFLPEDSVDSLKTYFDEEIGDIALNLGYNIKFGADLFLYRRISAGFVINFLVPDLSEFANKLTDNLSEDNYFTDNSYIELNLCYWF